HKHQEALARLAKMEGKTPQTYYYLRTPDGKGYAVEYAPAAPDRKNVYWSPDVKNEKLGSGKEAPKHQMIWTFSGVDKSAPSKEAKPAPGKEEFKKTQAIYAKPLTAQDLHVQ